MPYKKSFKGRKYGRRSNVPWYKKKYSPLDLAGKAMSGVNALRKLINVERKFSDEEVNNSVLTGSRIDWMSDVNQGTGYDERDGLSVKCVSEQIRGTFTLQGTTQTPTSVRMMIFVDLDSAGAGFTTADVLESSTVNSPLNHTNGKRFKILKDRVYSLSPNGTEVIHFKHYLKYSDHIRWSNATNGQREGHIYILFLPSSYTVSANYVVMSYFNRIRFIDN